MSKYHICEEHLKGIKPTAADQTFLDSVEDAVVRLMADGHLDIEVVASELCVHPTKLRRRVKTITGLTAHTFIYIIRLRKAFSMLSCYPRFSFLQTSQACGFADNAHFTHAFQRWVGCSPREYLEQKQQ